MTRSKIVVLGILLFIIVGTLAWAGAERFKSPDYNPEKAHQFLEHFFSRCSAEFNDEICGQVVGNHHRQCFNDHLRETPPEQIDEYGPVMYDRRAYTRCMRAATEDELSASSQ